MAEDGGNKGPSQSRIGRAFGLARLATDTSARFAMGMAKRAVGAGDQESTTPLGIEEHEKIAGRVAEILGNMKGLAMKVGQVVSYVDDWMPEEVRPTYSGVLSQLQAKAPKVSLAEMLNVFVDSIG